MTPTEKARRSDALYYETVSVTRRVLCDAIANREADLEDARAENDRLRESVRRLMTQRDERLAVAETDNAKLRELVRALLTSHEKMCTQRGNCFGCTFFYEEVKACPYVKISRTLRELGIEVDE